MTTTYGILSTILFFAVVAICLLARRLKSKQEENKNLASKNNELRGFLTTMNSELDCREAELMELAQDPNSLIGVKYRTQEKIKKNRLLPTMQLEEK